MKTILIKAFVLLSVSIVISCNSFSTSPVSGRRIKTPREMVWTCDTLVSPDSTSIQLLMKNIVGFSANDLWITGWCDVPRGIIWHYDGKSWKESIIVKDVGGVAVNDLAGYSSSDLWAGGFSNDFTFDDYAAFCHYDGNRWTKAPKTGVKGAVIDMCKDDNGNLWACARNGVVFKLIQGKWAADTIKISRDPASSYWLREIECYRGKMSIVAAVSDSKLKGEIFYYIEGDMNNWTIKDSFYINSPQSILKWGNFGLSSGNTGKLFTSGLGGIWEYDNGNWSQSHDARGTVYNVFAFRPDYMLAAGDYESILYFNGHRWENIFNLFPQADRYFVFKNVWTNGYETFIIGFTNDGFSKTLVWHGK